MNRLNGFLSLLALAGMAFQCKSRSVIHSGTFEGKSYTLTSVESKGFSTNSFTYELKLDRQKAVLIDAHTTEWGPPYADDLSGTAPRVYIEKQNTPYRYQDTTWALYPATMLYLSPERFSRQAFDACARFMTQVWPDIDKKYANQPYSSFRQIIGLVHGNQKDFRLTFTGKKEGLTYDLTVEPDGRIQYAPVTQGANYEYSGMSHRVQMPGKRILVSNQPNAGQVYDGLSMAQLSTYRNKKGKVLADYFTLIPDPTPNPN